LSIIQKSSGKAKGKTGEKQQKSRGKAAEEQREIRSVAEQRQRSQRLSEQRKFFAKSAKKKPLHSIAFAGLPKIRRTWD